MSVAPTLLLILDGFGLAPAGLGNAVSMAKTPVLDGLFSTYPHTSLACAGRAVGLPDGFMGNSEVGHMNIGAGRIVYQDMTRIDIAMEDGSFAANPVLLDLCAKAKACGGRLHLMGLVSDGGVHSHQNHIHALVALASSQGVKDIFIHAFLDGRDTPPKSGLTYVQALEAKLGEIGAGRVATVTGRYYAMDRDKHYERNELAYLGLACGQGVPVRDAVSAIQAAYDSGETDEFVKPRVVVDEAGVPLGQIGDGDALFFFNFRADRARQICRAFFEQNFKEFARPYCPKLSAFATMTQYESTFPLPAAFGPQPLDGFLGQVVSENGLTQLRIAETEKYAHVTYFLNCGVEEALPGEQRVLIPSPREVPTYDHKPQMSAREVTEALLERRAEFDLCVCNLANLDMVGHTGIIPAAIAACETVDECVGRLVKAFLDAGGQVFLTADHGNAEEMLDASGGPQTAHSTNPVPLLHIDAKGGRRLSPGKLGDIAPTILASWGLHKSAAMSGESLFAD
ncbi:MAG: 2,3-bisphosphoglycerate-independent phosphoglycerate mutase [Humidesulfovibrio sp.]|uniref:2,3-bisphosphoglycerate-independent phosphoglycerate mutase n=1 Tax=Humidesulfovibrio sp. TaxID=2910988 RepID=UPI0027354C4F|nr:2,3-bisphosphoglycerate-independent phosphoglycerate mutase [Humidesulfovibrio sp.]MDP2848018.1 2,3-bisphosphoglycerate-independent phosphoglycerate mutase [Humidesulfovibrio sp.]